MPQGDGIGRASEFGCEILQKDVPITGGVAVVLHVVLSLW
jgi:hypothetical protein